MYKPADLNNPPTYRLGSCGYSPSETACRQSTPVTWKAITSHCRCLRNTLAGGSLRDPSNLLIG